MKKSILIICLLFMISCNNQSKTGITVNDNKENIIKNKGTWGSNIGGMKKISGNKEMPEDITYYAEIDEYGNITDMLTGKTINNIYSYEENDFEFASKKQLEYDIVMSVKTKAVFDNRNSASASFEWCFKNKKNNSVIMQAVYEGVITKLK